METEKNYIMPRHTSALQDGNLGAGIVIHIMEVHDTSVVVILSWEKCLREVGGVNVGKGVVMSVPATEAEIESTNGGIMIVHHDNLAGITSNNW
jgi:hypothetical protein